jgi:alpha 1,3-glucosidase
VGDPPSPRPHGYAFDTLHVFVSFQTGAYLPFFRAHAHLDTKRREPWLFEDKYKNLMREAIRHRYALLPFWYTLFHEASKSGSPIVTYVKL